MEIKYLGHSSFFIKVKKTRIVIDPFDSQMVGFKFPKVEADIVLITHQHQDHNCYGVVSGTPIVFDWPGEYERLEVRIRGFNSYHDKVKGQERGENVIFKIETEEGSVVHCGDLGYLPDSDYLDKIGSVDILMVPVGGFYTIDASEAVELARRIEPTIIIPMHYKTSKHNPHVFDKLSPVEEFTKKLNIDTPQFLTKFVYKKEDEDASMKLVVMSSE